MRFRKKPKDEEEGTEPLEGEAVASEDLPEDDGGATVEIDALAPEAAAPDTGMTIENEWVRPEAVEPEPEPEPEPVAVEPEPEPEPEPVAVEPEPEPEPEPAAVEPEPEPVVPPLPISDEPYVSPFDTPVDHAPAGGAAEDRPEVLVGAAFAGGVIAAMMLRRLGR